MKDKYLVTYNDNIKKFKTKNEIMQHFDCPLYIVDKIIKKTEDDNHQEGPGGWWEVSYGLR